MPAVKRWGTRLVALSLLWMIFPGGLEATENLAHILVSGHLAHAVETGDAHSDPGPEHGCNAVFHACSCHLTPPGHLTGAEAASAMADKDVLFVDRSPSGASGHYHDIEHPPRS